jgi:hypothetical protein
VPGQPDRGETSDASSIPTVAFGATDDHRVRRVGYALTTVLLSGLMVAAVLDGLGGLPAFGVDAAWTTARGGAYELRVRHPDVTRPALASPFEIVVTRAGGFDGPIEIAIDRHYLALWDLNGIYPDPSAQRSEGPWVVWEIDPPSGDTTTVLIDARIEPAAQSGREGRVAVLDQDGQPVAQVRFHTDVRP